VSIIELSRKPSDTDLRWFGFIVAAFFGILGTVACSSGSSARSPG
jgi:hypothetical protein